MIVKKRTPLQLVTSVAIMALVAGSGQLPPASIHGFVMASQAR
jgi:hypothetical protein